MDRRDFLSEPAFLVLRRGDFFGDVLTGERFFEALFLAVRERFERRGSRLDGDFPEVIRLICCKS